MTSAVRNYKSGVPVKTLDVTGGILANTLQFNINDTNSLPAVPFTMVIEPDVAGKEEIITVTSISGVQLTVVRGEDNTTATPHINGVELRHMITARDLQNPRDHIDATKDVHGISGVTNNAVVGLKDIQILENKTLTSPVVNGGTLSGVTLTGTIDASSASITSYASDAELTTHTSDTTDVHGIADTSKLAKFGSTNAGRTIYVQTTTPTGTFAVGDIWIDY
jgi:hypothetical protein